MNPEKGIGEGSRSINLHPLAIISISDHYTRVAMGASVQSDSQKILGLLFGIQVGREVAIHDCYEMVFTKGEDGKIQLNEQSIQNQIELLTAVYPGYELLGWYSVGPCVQEPEDLEIQRSMMAFNESPLFLLMTPSADRAAAAAAAAAAAGSGGGAKKKKELPVKLFEGALHMVEGKPTLLFSPADFALRAAPAEQLAVEEVSRAAPARGGTAVEPHLKGMGAALATLGGRLQVLSAYLQMVKEGKIETDHKMLRQVYNLCQSLPAVDSEEFHSSFSSDYQDALVVAQLAALTKSAAGLGDLADKYLVTYGERHRRRAAGL